MAYKIIKCICGKEYPSRRDQKAKNTHDRPQCAKCGKREYKQ